VDSTSIVRWLDASFPTPRLFPVGPSELSTTLRVCDHVDAVLNLVVDLGTRSYVLHDAPGWGAHVSERIGRAHQTLEKLAQDLAALDRPTVGPDGINAADIWLATMVRWYENLPGRAATTPAAAQIMTLGWRIPESILAFAAPIHAHPIVKRWGI
jgi:glutathione S-transferase